MSDRLRSGARLLPLVALWSVPVLAVAIAFPLAGASEEHSVAPPRPAVVEVGSREADERTAVEVVVARAEALDVPSPVAGVVSSLGEPGPIVAGQELFAVEGVPVLAYRGAPLWRDLELGDRGEDVTALGQFLASLDLIDPSAVDDRFGPATRTAVRGLQERLGVRVDGRFRIGYVTRVADEITDVGEHLVALGARVAIDTPVIRGDQPVRSMSMSSIAGRGLGQLAHGPVALWLGQVEVPLSSTSPEGNELADAVAALDEATDAGTLERLPDDVAGVVRYRGGILALQEPIARGAVPSTAVRVADDGAACVVLSDATTSDLRTQRLTVAEPANEIATVLVDADLVGAQVVRDAAQVTSISGCT